MPRDVTKIISQFLLPSSEFTFNDKVALNTFKKIFSKQPITHIYNPLAVIAEMESNVVKLQEEKESFLDMLEKSKAMKNLIALNHFLRDNNFNALSLLCPNFQGYTPIVLALKKDANNIADRIQVALQMEKDIKQIRALLIGKNVELLAQYINLGYAGDFGISSFSNSTFIINDTKITPSAEENITEGVSLSPISGESGYVESSTHYQSDGILSDEARAGWDYGLFNNFNQQTNTNAYISSGFSGIFHVMEENDKNTAPSVNPNLESKINARQSRGPNISRAGVYYLFSRGCGNLAWAAQKMAAPVAKTLLYTYKNANNIKQGFYAFATNGEAVVNGIQQLVRVGRCSQDGTMRMC